jgi:2'-hydroxyisoflavone reductase
MLGHREEPMINRREFLRNAIAVALASRFAAAGAVEKAAPAKILALLIIGDGFVAAQVAEVAKRHGHSVTQVNRTMVLRKGQVLRSDGGAELIVGEGQRWDAVIDTSARVPVEVTTLPQEVVAAVGYYLQLSNTSVYAKLDKPGIDESAPVLKTNEPDAKSATDATASALRALCETAAEKTMPGRVCVVRAGLVAGPGDPSGRFTYWPVRVARGGYVLAPGKATDFVQFIDVRDLADFIVLCAERRTLGVFNADGKAGALTIGALLETCKKVSKSDARFVWADATFLAERGISFYRDMPVWAPPGGDYIGLGQISSAKAQAAGLHYRPLAETVKDTLAWYNADPAAEKTLLRAGLTPKREAQALKALSMKDVAPPAHQTEPCSRNPDGGRKLHQFDCAE